MFIITSKIGKIMANLYPFLIYVMVTTFTPGPNNIMSMTNAMRSGYRRTLRFLLGVSAGFFIVMLLCGFLNVVLVSLLPHIQFWLNILGVVYMLYLALHTIISKPVDDMPGKTSLNTFKAGVWMQFLNLKGILYGITVFSVFITPYFQDFISLSLFALFFALLAFISTTCWALGGAVFRTYYQKCYLLFNLVMGGLLLYTALHSLLSSLPS
jgi:cysteine/O-acetylserine efflux protein